MNRQLLTGKALMAFILFAFMLNLPDTLAQRRGGGGRQRSGTIAPAKRQAAPGNRSTGTVQKDRKIQSGNRDAGTSQKNNDINRNDRTAQTGDRNRNTNSNNRNNNINTGDKTVNINVDRSRDIDIHNNNNTVVRRNDYRPYTRAPYVYGGRRFYSYHPYFYHPYRPFYWGPVYHPWGFFVAALATTAIIVTVADQQYHYDQGVYYKPDNNGYTVVQAPVGAIITTLPANAQTVVVNETVNNYYYAGTFYEKSSKGYTVVAPTAGTIVASLPEGGVETKIGDVTYVKFGETYYQPIQQDGKNVYEVVKVEAEK